MRRSLAAAVVLTVGFGIAGPLSGGDTRWFSVASVRANGPDPALGAAWAQNRSLEYTWLAGSAPPSLMQTAINNAAAHANSTQASLAADFALGSGEGQVAYNYEPSDPNWLCGASSIACARRNLSQGWYHINFRLHGKVLPNGSGGTFTVRWCDVNPSPTSCWDTENVAMHEMGHVLGVDHHANPDYEDAIIQTSPRKQTSSPNTGWNWHYYAKCDVARLQALYDVSETHPISDCLLTDGSGMATALTLTAPSSASEGDPVVFSSTLKIANNASYPQLLRLQALSSRTTVTLYRAPVGTTSWVAIGTMSGSAGGVYTRTVTQSATTYQWYAGYAAAAMEGLVSSDSPALTVTVVPCSPSC